MKKKLCAVMLAAALILPSVIGASAAETDIAPSAADQIIAPIAADMDIGIVAGDYPDVGTDLEPEEPLPSSFSNREYATEVRRQTFNTCWAYSSGAVMEIVAAKAGIYNGWFSPMHMNYWATSRDDGTGWQRSYTGGGYPYIAIGYMTSLTGMVKEDDFPS